LGCGSPAKNKYPVFHDTQIEKRISKEKFMLGEFFRDCLIGKMIQAGRGVGRLKGGGLTYRTSAGAAS
jgi:hypothetical protein